jgi:murein DD-endopeptidase MepM/ murein hydrolase activator NlpD
MGLTWSCAGPTGPSPAVPADPALPGLVECAAFSEPASSPYVLPYAVGQGYRVNRTFEHYTALNGGVGLYAIDFGLPMHTPVHAARAGVVVAVEERFSDDDRADFHENWVMVRHADDTVARYIHLTRDGALVDVGDVVRQGQVVGLSGNSGPSNGPHLHFDVQTCGPNLPPGYNRLPCGSTVPVSFRNTERHGCGLDARRTYTALPFEPESR